MTTPKKNRPRSVTKRQKSNAKALQAAVKAFRTAHEIDPIKTVDQGVPEPPPFEGSGFDYQPDYETAGKVVDRIPNQGT